MGLGAEGNGDILAGWSFCATLQLRTPLDVLRCHGAVHDDPATLPPIVTTEAWQGIWTRRAKTFRELGLDLDEPEFSIASEIGPVPRDGGRFLTFLVAARSIIETRAWVDERRSRLQALLRLPENRELVSKLRGEAWVLDMVFPSFLSTVNGLSIDCRSALDELALNTPASVLAASDQALLAVPGLGRSRLVKLRAAAEARGGSYARYLDATSI